MPRTRLSGAIPNPRAVTKLIERYIKIERECTIEDAAARANVSRTLYYKRMKEPGCFTLAELRSFSKALKIPPEEMSAVLMEALKY